jgi:acetolactate synthase-1/2/3 large subunit
MTTWNGIDRFSSSHDLFWGRPNTWGQRASNVLIQQSDLIIAIGTRLGLQQSGFNWQGFAPLAKIVQVEIDQSEITKGHPKIDLEFNCDAKSFLDSLKQSDVLIKVEKISEWIDFGKSVRTLLPNNELANSNSPEYINPFDFVEKLSEHLSGSDVIIPCSSGGAFTTMMQAFNQKSGQIIVSDKGLASMGYGLSGAIGAAYANPNKRVILVEGDGGFAQNLQELGTAVVSGAALKIFIYSNNGYASIRMTQRSYFDGAYVGCDTTTGLGLPDWVKLFDAYGIESLEMNPTSFADPLFLEALADSSIRAFLVPIDPDQTYFPKISSRVLENGQMESNPLHLMSPELPDDIGLAVFKYLEV